MIPFVEKNTRTIRKSYKKIRSMLTFPPKVDISQKIRTKQEFINYCEKEDNKKLPALAKRLNEKIKKEKKEQDSIKGYCINCGRVVNLQYSFIPGNDDILFRERLFCPDCYFYNRARAMLYVIKKFINNRKDLSIYTYEQITILYSALQKLYGKSLNIVGSEFLDYNLPSGSIIDGIRHEDALNLSFEDESMDFMISMDVFEHVADLRKGFKEAYRVLKKGGYLLSTMPIDVNRDESLVRAIIENGEIIYLMEKEIHGNPLSEDGSLAFYNLGWDIMDMQKEAGFEDPYVIPILDKKSGHIDYYPVMIFVAQK